MRAPVSAIGDHLVRFFSRHVSILLYYRDLKLGNSDIFFGMVPDFVPAAQGGTARRYRGRVLHRRSQNPRSNPRMLLSKSLIRHPSVSRADNSSRRSRAAGVFK